MQTLTLLRHAKSEYVAGLTDFNRHLTEQGRRDALNMAKSLRDRECIPTLMLVSSAVRTRETAQILREALGLEDSAVSQVPDLYLASPDVLIHVINHATDAAHLMLVGHNPGLESLSMMLDPDAPERMNTCSVNHFELTKLDADAAGLLDTRHSDTSYEADLKGVESSASPDAGNHRLTLRGEWTARLSFHEQPAQ